MYVWRPGTHIPWHAWWLTPPPPHPCGSWVGIVDGAVVMMMERGASLSDITADIGSGLGEAHDQERLKQYAQAVLKPRAFQKKQRAVLERIPVLEHSHIQMVNAKMTFSDQFEAVMDLPMPELQFGP